MKNEARELVSELAELYEFSLDIGQSLDFEKNAQTFFSSFAQRRNLKHISVWHNKNNVLQYNASFPKLEMKPTQLSDKDDLYADLAGMDMGKVLSINSSSRTLPNQLVSEKLWVFQLENMCLFFVYNKSNHQIASREAAQLATVFKKFVVSCKACIAHRDLRSEMSKRQKAERRLFERESFFRFGANSLSEGIIVTDEKGVITYINRAMTPITGYRYDEMFMANVEDIFKPLEGDKSTIEVLMGKKYEDLDDVYEAKLVHKSGKVFWARIQASEFRNSENEVIGTIATILDVSERIYAHKDLEQNRKELQDLVDNMYEALVVFSADGFVTKLNKAAKKILRYGDESIGQLHMSDIVHPEDLVLANKHMALLKTQGYYSGYEGRIISGKGKIKYVEVNSTAIVENGKYVGSRDVIRDITEKKAIEAQKEEILSKLEEANQELRDFAYIVSHDLKAPLRSIGSLSDWLRQDYSDVLDEQGKELLSLLKGRISRMHNLIEGVLQYSKIGRLSNEKEEVNIQTLVMEVLDLLAPPSHCTVNVEVGNPVVRYDKIRLQQVFQNLVSNAVKFLDKPSGVIDIRMEEDEGFFYFGISDNGPGINSDYFDKIFLIFQTLKSKDEYESTGIGLSIVKRIVERNGGKIWVESVLGQGSTFTFSIPKID